MRVGIYASVALLMVATAPATQALKSIPGQGPDRELIDRLEEARDELSGESSAPSSSTATIRGFVFYNDQRSDGLFAERKDVHGNTGLRCDPDVHRPMCHAVTQRLSELRADRTEQAAFVDMIQASGKPHAQNQLDSIDRQITDQERRLVQCQASCGPNWLGGRYMVVDVFERDTGFAPTDVHCKMEERLASATVNRDGSFTATVPTTDPCNHDKLAGIAVELRARLRFCSDSMCFSINSDRNHPYLAGHAQASAAAPMTLKPGSDVTVAPMFFGTASDPWQPNNTAIAANYYASIVDTIVALHKDSTIPFYQKEFGEIQYLFPSTKSGTATARSPDEVVISKYQSQPDELGGGYAWIDGKTPAHEYGHILMQRAWGGSYGFDGIGITARDDTIAPSLQIAFKEAWAEFVARVVFAPTRGCSRSDYDPNPQVTLDCSAIGRRLTGLREDRRQQVMLISSLPGPKRDHAEEQLVNLDAQIAAEEKNLADCQADPTHTDLDRDNPSALKGKLGEGAQWRDNVTKALCDWHDATVDDDPNLVGDGDHFSGGDILAMWTNMRRMYLDAAQYGGEFKKPGLWFCDYVRYYLDVRMAVSAVGAVRHAKEETAVRDLIYNNNIGCSMSVPK